MNIQDIFVRPKPAPAPPSARLLAMRARYGWCFASEAQWQFKHDWSVLGPCRNCNEPYPQAKP